MSGAGRMLRGVLITAVSLVSAVLAHTAAGHHPPHAVVLVLALAVGAPLATALSSIRLSRWRLAGAVIGTQAVLHGLFVVLPAPSAVAWGDAPGAGDSAHSHGATFVDVAALTAVAESSGASHGAHGGVSPVMAAAHLAAAAAAYLLIRRGDLVLAALADLLTLRPIALLLDVLGHPLHVRPHAAGAGWPQPVRLRSWWGAGARTLRGPPVVVVP
ncbi:hypothetical protein [Nesterenkonia flava]|uniref:Integral membrane protein n=1 Tax=Nesterenkonia flava TaxID=469799 RepID=A0ABU1FQM5_9MICC|nr:hypothetical protein [Nesterenkonia flava]MDR5710899.1 hypothetical protein [Nesterenkonia flava]